MTTLPPEAKLNLSVSRSIAAPPEAIFDAWIDPEQMKVWFKPVEAIWKPVKGGLYFLLSQEYQGRNWPHFGRFLEITPPRKLVFTWMSEGTNGFESTVEVELSPGRDGKTDVALRHTGLPVTKVAQGHADGWAAILEEIERIASGKR